MDKVQLTMRRLRARWSHQTTVDLLKAYGAGLLGLNTGDIITDSRGHYGIVTLSGEGALIENIRNGARSGTGKKEKTVAVTSKGRALFIRPGGVMDAMDLAKVQGASEALNMLTLLGLAADERPEINTLLAMVETLQSEDQ